MCLINSVVVSCQLCAKSRSASDKIITKTILGDKKVDKYERAVHWSNGFIESTRHVANRWINVFFETFHCGTGTLDTAYNGSEWCYVVADWCPSNICQRSNGVSLTMCLLQRHWTSSSSSSSSSSLSQSLRLRQLLQQAINPGVPVISGPRWSTLGTADNFWHLDFQSRPTHTPSTIYDYDKRFEADRAGMHVAGGGLV